MLISSNIPLKVDDVLNELSYRQGQPWNNGRINDRDDFTALNKLFAIINSGIPREDFMYRGSLYRLHSGYPTLTEYIDPEKERIIGKVYSDGSCFALPITQYTDGVVAFSKSPDFTRPCFYKVSESEQGVLFHVSTGSLYGIDVNAFYHRFGFSNERYEAEQEVLFPLSRDTIIKEYHCTPKQFRYYLRSNLLVLF